MNSLRVIIIDDEKSSSDRLVNLLNAHNLVCVTGVFDTLETALAGIRARKPEAIFLDVHLDRKSTRLNSSHVRTSRMPSSA